MLSGQHNFFFGNRSAVVQPIDIIRWLSEHVASTKEALHIRNMLLNAVSSAEARSAGAGIAAMAFACDLILAPDERSGQKASADLSSQWVKEQLSQSHRCRATDSLRLMQLFDMDLETLGLAEETIRSCSSNASISVESSGDITHIREVHGHTFPCQLPDVFLTSSRMANRRHLVSPRVIVIDGMVERMSEIDDVIRWSHASRSPVLLFARGFDPEVQNTLGKNYSAGNLTAVPVCVPYDELGANMLNDISIVCDADLVSSLKGELISSRKWTDLKEIESALVTSGQVMIANGSTAACVKRQRAHLGEKKKTCNVYEGEIIDRRLQCLMGTGVVTNIGSDVGDLQGLYRDRVGSHIRLFRNCARHGVIGLKLKQEIKRGSALESLVKRFPLFPAAALVAGARAGLACAKNISTIGGLVCADPGQR
jgi:hypothetical protein